jgi:Gpi18-like mannosyltransferase
MDPGAALMEQDRQGRAADYAAAALVIAFGLGLRYYFRSYITDDYLEWTSRWYAAVKQYGIAATGTDVSNYTPPYMYFLYATSLVFPKLPAVMAIKIPSIAADFICAWFISRIVQLRYPEGRVPLFAFAAVLIAPTVICDSGVWGQADSIYTAPLIACVYFLMKGRSVFGMLAFGVAFSIKFQAMFLAPVLCALWFRHAISWRTSLLVPLVYVIAMIPAAVAGRPLLELATIYFKQSVTYHSLTKSAPNLYAWLSDDYYDFFVRAGLLLTVAVSFYYVLTVWKSRVKLDSALILELCTLSLLMSPFFLPKMHQRFFYPADVLAIAYAFYFPRRYHVAIAVSFASFFAYGPFLFGQAVLPLSALSVVMLIALTVVACSALRSLSAAPQAA